MVDLGKKLTLKGFQIGASFSDRTCFLSKNELFSNRANEKFLDNLDHNILECYRVWGVFLPQVKHNLITGQRNFIYELP